MASPTESPSLVASFSVTMAPASVSPTSSWPSRVRKCHSSLNASGSDGATMVVMASVPSAPWAIMEVSVARTATGSFSASPRRAAAASRSSSAASSFSEMPTL